MTTRSDSFRHTEARPTVLRSRARRVEDRLRKAGLSFSGNLRSNFPGQCADVILPAGELLWKRPIKPYWG